MLFKIPFKLFVQTTTKVFRSYELDQDDKIINYSIFRCAYVTDSEKHLDH